MACEFCIIERVVVAAITIKFDVSPSFFTSTSSTHPHSLHITSIWLAEVIPEGGGEVVPVLVVLEEEEEDKVVVVLVEEVVVVVVPGVARPVEVDLQSLVQPLASLRMLKQSVSRDQGLVYRAGQ